MIVTESVVSVAVNTGAPVVVDFTVKVATPLPLVVPEVVVIVSVAPRLEARVIVFPEIPALAKSFSVTVIVEVVVPSAPIELGEALTVEVAAEAACVKVTVAV